MNLDERRQAAAFTVSLYNPALLKKDDLIRGFVARRPLLDGLLDELRREASGSSLQHHLIIGQRGLGKTTLLRRLAFAVEDSPELAAAWTPLVFPEEQYNVASLGDFWLNCVDALSDALDRSADRAASQALDSQLDSLPAAGAARASAALNLLLAQADRLGKRILLLVDNIDIVLDRLDDKEEWEFRRILSEERRLHFIGASSRILEAFYEYGRPFYDFFQVHELKGFDDQETLAALSHLAAESGNEQVERVVRERPGRIKALRLLTGGNPRTLVLLFKVFSQGPEGDVQHDLEQLLDEYTPLFKARFEELPAQSQQIVDAMAIHWDPVTAAELARQLQPMNVSQVSAQLNRLKDFGVVEETPWYGEKKKAFQIAERFFNIWYLMRASRRVRRRLVWLVKFLEIWFERDELDAQARRLLERDPESMGRERYAEMALAYSQSVSDRHLRLNLESAGLHAVLDDGVRRLIDFSDLPPELQDKKERIEQLRDLRAKVCSMNINWGGINPADFWRLLGGSRYFSLGEKARIVEQLPSLQSAIVRDLFEKLAQSEHTLLRQFKQYSQDVARLYDALAGGEMAGVYDYENAIAVAKRYGLSRLPYIAIASRINVARHHQQLSQGEVTEAERALRSMTEEKGFESLAWFGMGKLLESCLQRYIEAKQAYRHAIKLDPQDAWPWIGLGNLLQHRMESYEEAEEAYRRAIELDSQNASPWNGLGNLLANHLKRYGEAEEAYRRAIELDPQDVWPWIGLGNLLQHRMERYEEAEEAHRRAIELDPQGTWPWNNLGWLLANHLNRYGEAEEAYRRAIELDSQDAWPWNGLGNLLANHLKRYGEAEQAYLRAIELDPENAWPWNGLGNLLANHLKRYGEAEQAYLRAIKLDPENAWPWNNLGDLLANHLKQYGEAEQAYLRAIELDSENAWPWNNLGDLLATHLKRYGEAEQAYLRAIELDSENAWPWSNLGNLRANHLTRCGEAERAYLRAIELDPENTYSWSDLVELSPHRRQKAADAHLRAFEIDRTRTWDLSAFLDLCRQLAEKSGDPTGVMKLVEKAHDLAPANTSVKFLLAQILTQTGKWHDASQLLEQVAASESEFFDINFFQAAAKTGHLDEVIAVLERTSLHERWRPLYEALRAAQAGTADFLNTVAPEVRIAAAQILDNLGVLATATGK